jgi:hypothetical protein
MMRLTDSPASEASLTPREARFTGERSDPHPLMLEEEGDHDHTR